MIPPRMVRWMCNMKICTVLGPFLIVALALGQNHLQKKDMFPTRPLP